jgi:hypothetical protein
VKGKGTVAIEGHTGLKLISNVLYVSEINQNLLSVGQLLEKGYKVLFEDNHCLITAAQVGRSSSNSGKPSPRLFFFIKSRAV